MRDFEGLQTVGVVLTDLNLFATVLVGVDPPNYQTGGASFPRAWVKQAGWKEESLGDPETKLRLVSYRLEIAVQRPDAGVDSGDLLDQLGQTVGNALNDSDLSGSALPAWSRLASGTYSDRSGDGATVQCQTLNGLFAYLVDGDSRDTGDDQGVLPAVPVKPPGSYFSSGYHGGSYFPPGFF